MPLKDIQRQFPSRDVSGWAEAGTLSRLLTIAREIAARCRSAKMRASPPHHAIRDWEADLEWLRTEVFAPQCQRDGPEPAGQFHKHYRWPSTAV